MPPIRKSDMTAAELRAVMERHGLSRRVAARAFGLSDNSLARYLRGEPIPQAIAILIRLYHERKFHDAQRS